MLSQNYPNPFNPITTIQFNLPKRTVVNLSVYDVSGRLVECISNDIFSSGQHEIQFNASDYPSGIYVYRIQAGSYAQTKKMLFIK